MNNKSPFLAVCLLLLVTSALAIIQITPVSVIAANEQVTPTITVSPPISPPAEVMGPTPGKWFSEQTAFEVKDDSILAGAEGHLKIDFSVAENQKNIIGIMSLGFTAPEFQDEYVFAGAWATGISADGSFSLVTELPAEIDQFQVTWSGEFISPTEIKGKALIDISFVPLSDEFEWSAKLDPTTAQNVEVMEQVSTRITSGEWSSEQISFEIDQGPFSGEMVNLTFEFTVSEEEEYVQGSTSLDMFGLINVGTWNSNIDQGAFSGQVVSDMELYTNWAGTFVAPDRVQGIAIIGFSGIFYDTIEWTAIPISE